MASRRVSLLASVSSPGDRTSVHHAMTVDELLDATSRGAVLFGEMLHKLESATELGV
jgi:hypothetical protein